jgi:hypothetical protein
VKSRACLTTIAAAVAALGLVPPALAGEPIPLGDDWVFDWRVNLTYTLSGRVKDQDPVLAKFVGANDGDNNFNKHALTSNRLGALLDTKVSKGDTGVVVSASTFYDDAYHGTNDNNPGNGLPNAGYNPNGVNHSAPFDQFTGGAKKYQGGYTRLLDGYGYTSFALGESSKLNLRAGRLVVSWGEALFFPGISAAQSPFDGTKTGIPGTEVKDAILSEDQIYATFEINPRWSLLGHLQFAFHETIAPAPGYFLNSSDGVGPGGKCLGPFAKLPAVPGVFAGFEGCSFGNRQDDIRPDGFGQWGIGTRYRVTDETEVGLYYINYKDRTPIPVINAFTPGTPVPAFFNIPGNQIGNGSYKIKYFDDIDLIGATFSTTLGIVTVAGEVSYRQGAPVLVNTLVNPAAPNSPTSYIPNPTRADITQLNVNAFANLGRTAIADSMLLIGEIVAYKTTGVEAIKAPGVENLPAAQQAFFPASNTLSFGSSNALAAQAQVVLGYPGIVQEWDLTVPISYAQQIQGRTLANFGGEGDKRYSVGATLTYRGNLSIGLTYLGFLGGAKIAPLEQQHLLADRDQLSLVLKYSL